MCHGLMGFAEHILQILKSECCHPSSIGRGSSVKFLYNTFIGG